MAVNGRNDGRPVTSGPGGINEGDNASEPLIRSRVRGDAFDRWQRTVGGQEYLGDGTTAPALQSGTNVVHVAAPTGVAATDTAAIVAGVAAAAALPLGGDVLLQAGNYFTNASIAVPPFVRVRGAGMRATVITYSGTSYAFSVGNATLGTALAYGCAIVDLAINLTVNGGNGITLRETAAAQVRNVYIEGVVTTNTSIGVFVDGGNSANIFTQLDNITCNHIKFSYRWGSSGASTTTSVNAIQCTGFGDLAAGSVGLQIDTSSGDGSEWTGGNLESYATALSVSGSNVSFFGLRFEANTVDVSRPSATGGKHLRLVGCHYIGSFTDSAGTGFNALSIIGCSKEDGTPYPDTLIGSSVFESFAAADIPISAKGFPTQSGKMLRLASNLNATLFDVDASGTITALSGRTTQISASTGYPNGAISASTGSICVVEGGGGGQTLWVKEGGGTGNTGWVAMSSDLTGSATYDPPSILDNTVTSTTVTVSGAALGDSAVASFSLAVPAGAYMTAHVTAANTVTVNLVNRTGAALDLASGTLRARVTKF